MVVWSMIKSDIFVSYGYNQIYLYNVLIKDIR